jgi:hypothetical protein
MGMQTAGFGSSFTFSAYSQAITSVPEGETLQVFELPEGYVLNVPVSSLAVTIPRKNMRNNIGAGSKLNPRYFLFQNERRPDISISGWIEPAKNFTSATKILEGDKIQWEINGLPHPTDVEFKKIGGWDAVLVLYNMKIPGNLHSSIRAHWIQESTWIDIHISSLTDAKSTRQCRATLRKLLGQIRVENTNDTL